MSKRDDLINEDARHQKLVQKVEEYQEFEDKISKILPSYQYLCMRLVKILKIILF